MTMTLIVIPAEKHAGMTIRNLFRIFLSFLAHKSIMAQSVKVWHTNRAVHSAEDRPGKSVHKIMLIFFESFTPYV